MGRYRVVQWATGRVGQRPCDRKDDEIAKVVSRLQVAR